MGARYGGVSRRGSALFPDFSGLAVVFVGGTMVAKLTID
jgi:hypothetical protein